MKKKSLSAEQEWYAELVKKHTTKPKYGRNILYAFLFGGLVAVIGQGITDFYRWFLDISFEEAGNPAVATMIFIGSLLTGLGVFDKLVKIAGAGVLVPVTGFANSVVSAAMEFKREGFVAGVGSKMFILAGTVIVFGVITAFIIGIIYAIFVF